MKTSKVFLNISAVVCYLYGALYIFSLVFIPVGIYCFICAKRFASKADNINDVYYLDKNIFRNWVIFASVACFPLGLLSIIPYVILTGNNIKVSSENKNGFRVVSSSDGGEHKQNVESVTNSSNEESVVEPKQVEVETLNNDDDEKYAKFEKLKNFREKGLITDDELEMAKEQLFGKDYKD